MIDIKDIIEKLKDSVNNPIIYVSTMDGTDSEPIENTVLLELNEIKILLCYITNLQEENERLNNMINELEKWLKNEHENGCEVYYIMAIQDIFDKLEDLKERR